MARVYSDFAELRDRSGIFVQCSGGLGNQLFQLALANELSKRTSLPVALEISPYKLHYGHEGFVIGALARAQQESDSTSPSITTLPSGLTHLNRLSPYLPRLFELLSGLTVKRERTEYIFDPSLELLQPRSLISGHWQSLKYFETTRDGFLSFLRSQLESVRARQVLKEILNCGDRPIVMVHVRRGDYVNNKGMHGLLGRKYYEASIEHLRSNLHEPVFLVFSDEPDRVKDEGTISTDAHYFQDEMLNSLEVLSFMTACDHFVIANSTFSWWGAAIGSHGRPGSIVTSPDPWLANGNAPELLLPNWNVFPS